MKTINLPEQIQRVLEKAINSASVLGYSRTLYCTELPDTGEIACSTAPFGNEEYVLVSFTTRRFPTKYIVSFTLLSRRPWILIANVYDKAHDVTYLVELRSVKKYFGSYDTRGRGGYSYQKVANKFEEIAPEVKKQFRNVITVLYNEKKVTRHLVDAYYVVIYAKKVIKVKGRVEDVTKYFSTLVPS